jgi:hypothetical protein
MAVYGQGVVPSSGNITNELTAVMRRAFVPKLVVQIYSAAPVLSLMMRNAQRARGGLSQVTVPVQGSSFVNFGWTGYDGSFPQPQVLTGTQQAAWNLSVGTVPIPLLGMESLLQQTETIIPLVKARMVDAKTVAVQAISSAMFGSANSNPLQINGFQDIYDDGTVAPVYGGINRNASGQGYWKSNKYSTSLTPSRTTMMTQIMSLTAKAGGESPDFIVMSLSDWTTLMEDYMSVEQFNTDPATKYGNDNSVNAGFRALMLANIPILADPFCPKGTAYIINSKYLGLYISEDANFAFSGWHSLISNNQIAQVGVIITAMALANTKPVTGMQLSNVAGGAF